MIVFIKKKKKPQTTASDDFVNNVISKNGSLVYKYILD